MVGIEGPVSDGIEGSAGQKHHLLHPQRLFRSNIHDFWHGSHGSTIIISTKNVNIYIPLIIRNTTCTNYNTETVCMID